jgi:hypothetical protein
MSWAAVSIAVDVYHVWWDPNLKREIERAAGATPSVVAYHICDWLSRRPTFSTTAA